ncbi:hypothetical protein JCM19301_2349 [Jejuia pallidilutea]|jgi:hypothetical protein|nr:hypothetical protein JCM19301_2349 [Jejuia pallidilutea]GAL73425.1 hypothetical protein JCM19302_3207 [Jejuia pallidilutea]
MRFFAFLLKKYPMFKKGISKGDRGNREPYFNLLTIMTSSGNKAFFIEELGILNALKNNIFKLKTIEKHKPK